MCLTFWLCRSVKKKGFQYHFWYQKPFGCSLLPRAVTNYTIWCGSSAKGAALFAKQSVNLLAPNLNDHDLALFDFDFRLIPAADDFLNRPNLGLHIPPGIWASEINFSSGAICLVLASHRYDAGDYVRDYNTFLEIKNEI